MEVLKKNFNHTSRLLECDEKFRLMIQKGVYPYEYMDGREKFEETSLSSKDAFYSSLSMKGISDRDYEHAQQVWNSMEKKTLGCYHDIYLKTDVLLLADVLNTEAKDQNAKIVAGVEFVSTIREDHNAKIVAEVKFVSTTG